MASGSRGAVEAPPGAQVTDSRDGKAPRGGAASAKRGECAPRAPHNKRASSGGSGSRDAFEALPEAQVTDSRDAFEASPEARVTDSRDAFEASPEARVTDSRDAFEASPEAQVTDSRDAFEAPPEAQVTDSRDGKAPRGGAASAKRGGRATRNKKASSGGSGSRSAFEAPSEAELINSGDEEAPPGGAQMILDRVKADFLQIRNNIEAGLEQNVDMKTAVLADQNVIQMMNQVNRAAKVNLASGFVDTIFEAMKRVNKRKLSHVLGLSHEEDHESGSGN
jgi:hypothetical protein